MSGDTAEAWGAMRNLVLLIAVACCLFGATSTADAKASPKGKAGAERAVKKRLARSLPVARHVACHARGRAGWSCRWRAESRHAAKGFRRCRGTDRVTAHGRRIRARARRCVSVRPATVHRDGQTTKLPASAKRAPTSVKVPPAKAPAAGAKPPAAPPAAKPSSRVMFGFNDNGVRAGLLSASDDAQLTQRVGADVTRLTMDWRWLEPQRGQYNWSAYDDIYREMTARGIKPVFILMFAPSWALDSSTPCDQWHVDCRMPPGRAHDADWARIAALVAQRYPKAAGIEIWNEPNEATFWQRGVDPSRYTELLKLAYSAIKKVNPSMTVLGGSMSNRQYAEAGAMTQTAFLQGMYQAGAKGSMDALSVHPYPWSLVPTLMLNSLNQVRSVRDAYGDSKLPLWVTEIGLSTTGLDRYAFTVAQQATGLTGIYTTLASMSDVKAVMVHTLLSSSGSAGNRELGYAVLNPDRTPKPAYCALGVLRGVTACP